MRFRLLAALGLATALGGGCNTAVGNYFANRARDFGECWRAEAGLGIGLGAGVRALGVGPLGFSFSNWGREFTVGAVYGELLPSVEPTQTPWSTELVLGFMGGTFTNRRVAAFSALPSGGKHGTLGDPEYGVIGLVVPALCGARVWEGPEGKPSVIGWIWSAPPPRGAGASPPPRWWSGSALHAFDVEAHAFALVVGVRVGFSPGEFVDFVLGWFGLDIAGDDRELPKSEGG